MKNLSFNSFGIILLFDGEKIQLTDLVCNNEASNGSAINTYYCVIHEGIKKVLHLSEDADGDGQYINMYLHDFDYHRVPETRKRINGIECITDRTMLKLLKYLSSDESNKYYLK